jgi:hypothetical protein
MTFIFFSLLSLASAVKLGYVTSSIQSPPSSASLPTADQVLDNYVQALGGKAALEKVTSRMIKGEIEWNDGEGTAEHYFKAPNKYMSVTNLVGIITHGVLRDGFNGAAGWTVNVTGAQRDWSSAEVARAQRHRDFYKELRLKTLYQSITLKGKEKIGNKDVYVLELRPTEGRPEKMYFDLATGLLLRHEYAIDGAQGVTNYEYNYDDYREVDGVKVAFTIHRGKPSKWTIKVSEVKSNLNLEDEKFNKPAAK